MKQWIVGIAVGISVFTASCGIEGDRGSMGLQGPPGPPGPVASSSPNPPSVDPVLCASCDILFPFCGSKAYCINGSLYAAMSLGGKVLVKLEPGSYHAKGHNCECSFKVEEGCRVSE